MKRGRLLKIWFLVVLGVGLAAAAYYAWGAADRTETVSVWEKAQQHRITAVQGSAQVKLVLILDDGSERCGIMIPSQKARALGTDLKQAADDADATAAP